MLRRRKKHTRIKSDTNVMLCNGAKDNFICKMSELENNTLQLKLKTFNDHIKCVFHV